MSTVETANRKMERADIAVLEALDAAPDRAMRWEDRTETHKEPPVPGAPTGAPPRLKSILVQGLESTVNQWCDEHPWLTVIPQKEREVKMKDGTVERYTPDPYLQRCTIARLEALVGGGLVEHAGAPDQDSAGKPTRELRLSKAGAEILALFRKNRVAGCPYPDPKAPKPAKAEELKVEEKAEKKGEKAGAAA